MDFTHIHLFLNHVPVVGFPFSLVVLVVGLKTQDEKILRLAKSFLVFTALIVIPVYFTGEPAEETVGMLPGVESLVHPHEEAGEVALILTAITGLLSFCLLAFYKKIKFPIAIMHKILLALALISCISLAYTGFKGGQIRHSEIRSE